MWVPELEAGIGTHGIGRGRLAPAETCYLSRGDFHRMNKKLCLSVSDLLK
jgi:hypothetical protein